MNNNQNLCVFNYLLASDFLRAVYLSRKTKRGTYSLRLWTRQLGLSDSESGNLSRILSGERSLSAAMTQKMSEHLELATNERAYFELLCLGSGKVSIESLAIIRAELRKEVPQEVADERSQSVSSGFDNVSVTDEFSETLS